MTSAAAATAIRAAIEEGCRKDPEYRALALRELANVTTWSTKGALQQSSEPDVLEAAGEVPPASYPHNTGSRGRRPFAVTRQGLGGSGREAAPHAGERV